MEDVIDLNTCRKTKAFRTANKKLRKSRGFSQLNLSVKLGITREHLSKIERGVTFKDISNF